MVGHYQPLGSPTESPFRKPMKAFQQKNEKGPKTPKLSSRRDSSSGRKLSSSKIPSLFACTIGGRGESRSKYQQDDDDDTDPIFRHPSLDYYGFSKHGHSTPNPKSRRRNDAAARSHHHARRNQQQQLLHSAYSQREASLQWSERTRDAVAHYHYLNPNHYNHEQHPPTSRHRGSSQRTVGTTSSSTCSVNPENGSSSIRTRQRQRLQIQDKYQVSITEKYQHQDIASIMRPLHKPILREDKFAFLPKTTIPSIEETASMSFSFSSTDDTSLLSFEHEDRDSPTLGIAPPTPKNAKELMLWRRQASEAFDRHGIDHPTTAIAFLELGMAHVRNQQFGAAHDFLKSANRVLAKRYGANDLRVAKSLEALAAAQSGQHSKSGTLLGLQSLRECFRVRYDILGPLHIDTVETLNNIANLYMILGMYESAKHDYYEVMTVRSVIMGPTHASVAVAARSLGLVHLMLNDPGKAKAYYLQALNVFAVNGQADHPFAAKLRTDIGEIGFELTRMEI